MNRSIDEDSASVSTGAVKIVGARYLRFSTSDRVESLNRTLQVVHADISRHRTMLTNASIDASSASALIYVRVGPITPAITRDDGRSGRTAVLEQHYDDLERQLLNINEEVDEDGDALVEEGAVTTAQSILRRLRKSEYAPPLMSWHGGDAVVMLWKIGSDTIAFTITDGEMGYIVRRDKLQIQRKDSIKPEQYRLEDLK